MASKTKHYTPVEKKIFLDILKQYKDVLENKRNDGSTLKEKNSAWEKVMIKYNHCKEITQDRTVPQLKKLWNNMKQTQRTALTKENQNIMTTGGGPQLPAPEIDPDVAAIAPYLMQTAPAVFSYNILQGSRNISIEEDEDDQSMIEEYLDEEFLGYNGQNTEEQLTASGLASTPSTKENSVYMETALQSSPRMSGTKKRRISTKSSKLDSISAKTKNEALK